MAYFGGSAVVGRRLYDRVLLWLAGGHFVLGVRGSFMKRWGRTISSLVAWVAKDMAARLIDGRHAGDFQFKISVGNPRGQRVPCYC
jgi:hypothetical protein